MTVTPIKFGIFGFGRPKAETPMERIERRLPLNTFIIDRDRFEQTVLPIYLAHEEQKKAEAAKQKEAHPGFFSKWSQRAVQGLNTLFSRQKTETPSKPAVSPTPPPAEIKPTLEAVLSPADQIKALSKLSIQALENFARETPLQLFNCKEDPGSLEIGKQYLALKQALKVGTATCEQKLQNHKKYDTAPLAAKELHEKLKALNNILEVAYSKYISENLLKQPINTLKEDALKHPDKILGMPLTAELKDFDPVYQILVKQIKSRVKGLEASVHQDPDAPQNIPLKIKVEMLYYTLEIMSIAYSTWIVKNTQTVKQDFLTLVTRFSKNSLEFLKDSVIQPTLLLPGKEALNLEQLQTQQDQLTKLAAVFANAISKSYSQIQEAVPVIFNGYRKKLQAALSVSGGQGL